MKMNNNLKLAMFSGLVGIVVVLVIPSPKSEPLVSLAADALPKTVTVTVIQETIEIDATSEDGGLEPKFTTGTVVYAGSGVFISPNGHVLTCAHLFNGGVYKTIVIKTYGEWEYFGELINIDPSRDLALVKINDITPRYAKLADPRKMRVGQQVIAIGCPFEPEFEFSVSHGIISKLNTDMPKMKLRNMTQSDTFINRGNSGGPLFNLDGELVGINSFIYSQHRPSEFVGLGFSVNPGQIIEFLVRFTGLPKFDSTTYWRK